MLLPPCEDATLSVAPAHESLNFLAIQTLSPRAISQPVALFEVDSVLV